jgi:hypothetical protein
VNAGSKLGAFALALGAALGGGALVGNAVGPIAATEDDEGHDQERHAPDPADPAEQVEVEALPAGLLVSQDGYSLEADTTAFPARPDPGTPLTFRIVGPDGARVKDFEVAHESELHLIVVSRDLGTYAHLHPHRAADGTWSVPLPALAPGVHRAFADFAVAGGPELTLGVDITVAGEARFAPLPEPVATADVEGYHITLAGAPVAGAASELTLTVERDGQPVTDLEPYLGAVGHLVALRDGDLAYLHVHPLGDEPGDGDRDRDRGGPGVAFSVDVPSPGDYRLFFDFAHGGEVRTAAFTVHVPRSGSAGAPAHDGTEGHG